MEQSKKIKKLNAFKYQNLYQSDKQENLERKLRVQKLANRILYMQTEEKRAWSRVKRAKFKTKKLLQVKQEKRKRENTHLKIKEEQDFSAR